VTVLLVWFKELLDTLRDRRTLAAMVIGPVLVMPVFVLLPQTLLQRQAEAQEQSTIRAVFVGAENGPQLFATLLASGEIERVEADEPRRLLQEDGADVGLVIPPGFEASLAQGRTAVVQMLVDQSDMFSVQAERFRTLLSGYNQAVVTQRLEALGIDPQQLVPFTIEDVNIATPQQMGGSFLGMMLPMFIVLWALVGGMYTAIDVTAGEKERLTLEPLLTTPVQRRTLVLGKLLAVVTTSLVALILAVASMLIAFAVAPPVSGNTGLGIDLPTAALLMAAALPVVVLFSALEMAVCLLARSFKEAQNYIVPMQFAVLIPAMAVMVLPDLSPSLPSFAIPVFSTLVILRDLFLGQVEPASFGLMVGSSLVYAALAVGLAIWQFGREKVLFRT